MSGTADVVLAVGVESTSRVPMRSHDAGVADPDRQALRRRYPSGLVHQGISAELISAWWELTCTELDEFSLASPRQGSGCHGRGPLRQPVRARRGADERRGIRSQLTMEQLAGLRPAFHDESMSQRFPEIGWDITAGNASQISDGAAAVLVMSRDKADAMGLAPLARVHSMSVVGDDPLYMLTAVGSAGPVPRSGEVRSATVNRGGRHWHISFLAGTGRKAHGVVSVARVGVVGTAEAGRRTLWSGGRWLR